MLEILRFKITSEALKADFLFDIIDGFVLGVIAILPFNKSNNTIFAKSYNNFINIQAGTQVVSSLIIGVIISLMRYHPLFLFLLKTWGLYWLMILPNKELIILLLNI